jgi:hypothetical protein
MYTSKDLEKLCRIIETFNVEEHLHILQIIKDSETINNVSENNNGIFINMEDLMDGTIKKIQEYTDYVLVKELDIKKVEDEKDKLKNDINNFHILNHTNVKN